jgi:CRP-like cAMP-binding protein
VSLAPQTTHEPLAAHARLPRMVELLPHEEVEHLKDVWQRVPLAEAQTLAWPDDPITHVHFPISGIVSIIAHGEGSQMVEAALVGREGLVGLPVFLGLDSEPHRVQVQVPGEAWRLPAGTFRTVIGEEGPLRALRRLLLRYAQARLVMASQGVLCNRMHALEERCARWLLTIHDRVEGDTFGLTHEFIAIMLGVRRASVTVAMGALQQAGLLHYDRGQIAILERPGLEAASCRCYRLIRRQFDQVR